MSELTEDQAFFLRRITLHPWRPRDVRMRSAAAALEKMGLVSSVEELGLGPEKFLPRYTITDAGWSKAVRPQQAITPYCATNHRVHNAGGYRGENIYQFEIPIDHFLPFVLQPVSRDTFDYYIHMLAYFAINPDPSKPVGSSMLPLDFNDLVAEVAQMPILVPFPLRIHASIDSAFLRDTVVFSVIARFPSLCPTLNP